MMIFSGVHTHNQLCRWRSRTQLRHLGRAVWRVPVNPVRTGVSRETSDDANDTRKDSRFSGNELLITKSNSSNLVCSRAKGNILL